MLLIVNPSLFDKCQHPSATFIYEAIGSIESMAQVLSSKNQELLKKIRDNNPESLAELASISGRHVSNLSRTLKNMEKYGIVELDKKNDTVKPLIRVDKFKAVFSF